MCLAHIVIHYMIPAHGQPKMEQLLRIGLDYFALIVKKLSLVLEIS